MKRGRPHKRFMDIVKKKQRASVTEEEARDRALEADDPIWRPLKLVAESRRAISHCEAVKH